MAIQVYKQFLRFLTAETASLRPGLIIGGFSKEKQLRILNSQPKILIATPGRLLDLIKERSSEYIKYLSMIQFLVIDEVDRIIELNQFKEIKEIFHYINTLFLQKHSEKPN